MNADTGKIIAQIGGSASTSDLDHLVISKLPALSQNTENTNKIFNGNIFGLVYNQFRILDLLAQDDPRIKTSGRLNLIESVSTQSKNPALDCNDSNSINYDINQCGENNNINNNSNNKEESDPYSDTESTEFENNNWDTQSFKNKYIPDQLEIESSRESTTIMSGSNNEADKATSPSIILTDETKTSYSLIIGVTIASFLVLLLLIFAIYKYRNRDEGSYIIDETKNCGPFAELDAHPLNGPKNCNSNGNNRRKNLKNKEWFV